MTNWYCSKSQRLLGGPTWPAEVRRATKNVLNNPSTSLQSLLTTRRPKIMVVDDEEDITICFKTMLEEYGYDVDTFTNPQAALDSFSSKRYDIVITDIQMPEMNGFELARRIYEIDKDIKIVIITAFDHVTTKEEITKLLPSTRINTLIRKPVEMMKLIDHLSIVLGSNYKRDQSPFSTCFQTFIVSIIGTITLTLISLQTDMLIC